MCPIFPGCMVNRRLKSEYLPNLGSKAKLSRKFRVALTQGINFSSDLYPGGEKSRGYVCLSGSDANPSIPRIACELHSHVTST